MAPPYVANRPRPRPIPGITGRPSTPYGSSVNRPPVGGHPNVSSGYTGGNLMNGAPNPQASNGPNSTHSAAAIANRTASVGVPGHPTQPTGVPGVSMYTLPEGRPASGGYYDPISRTYRTTQTPAGAGGGFKPPERTGPFQGALAGSPQAGPPEPTPFPGFPIDFSAMFSGMFGGGGAGGGVGGGGGGGGGGTPPGPPPGPPPPPGSPGATGFFQGSPSSYMEEVYRKAMEQYANAPDMVDRNLVLGRDATTQAMREVQGGLTGRLGAGFAAPGAASRISDAAARNLNAGMADASQQKFNMQQAALGLGGQMGSGIAGDLRAQEGMGINAYNAQTNAWQAAQQAYYNQQRLSLESQLAQMQMALGFLTPFLNMYSNMYSGRR